MRRAQERGLAGRPYAEKMNEVISVLARVAQTKVGSALHPCLECRQEIRSKALVVVSPDRGMCGGLISNLNRTVGTFLLEQKVPVEIVAVGRKGLDFFRRTGRTILAEFTDMGDRPSFVETLPISRIILDDFSSGKVDEAYLVYSRFISTMYQQPVIERILPVVPAELPPDQATDYTYEPEPGDVLDELLPRFVEMRVYQVILESIASEQSARMVAMRNATENASELVQDLTLQYNKARQDVITRELLDITAGKMALEQER